MFVVFFFFVGGYYWLIFLFSSSLGAALLKKAFPLLSEVRISELLPVWRTRDKEKPLNLFHQAQDFTKELLDKYGLAYAIGARGTY